MRRPPLAFVAPVPGTVVCLPTYNERENLERMLRSLVPLGVRVLVIDDNSPDGTGELADRLAAELDCVSVLHRERKEGLGPAYLAGFREVLAGDAEYVLEMDCDFSHDPADVPRLIAACARGADLALGSRYVEGGGTANWGLARRVVSAGGSLYARFLLGLAVRDLTGGFKCFRREVLEAIQLRSDRFGFEPEVTIKVARLGCRIYEVPIAYHGRTYEEGKKIGWKDGVAALFHMLKYRFFG